MTKSIHRAILEYQHSQCGVLSPRSPLDLRVRSALARGPKCTRLNCSSKSRCNKCLPESTGKRVRLVSTKQSEMICSFDTVYKQVEPGNGSHHNSFTSSTPDICDANKHANAIPTTPPRAIRNQLENVQHGELADGAEVWHTPSEHPIMPPIDNAEVMVST